MSALIYHLKQQGHLDSIHITICAVGSRKLGQNDDYAAQGWGIFAPNLTIYGFDADADACEAANTDIENRAINWQEQHIPLALADVVGEKTLYVTQHPMCSSLYPPNEPFLNRFENLSNLAGLDFTLEIETTTLDTFCEAEQIPFIDYLQIDVQGADLDVLRGSRQILSTVLAVQIEVEFAPLYKDQPLFSDIDVFLRAQGFSLFDLRQSYWKRARSPISSAYRKGQLLWGEAYYIRDPFQNADQGISLSPEQILKLACIADLTGFPDFSVELLEHLQVTLGKIQPRYHFTKAIENTLVEMGMSEETIAALPLLQKLRSL